MHKWANERIILRRLLANGWVKKGEFTGENTGVAVIAKKGGSLRVRDCQWLAAFHHSLAFLPLNQFPELFLVVEANLWQQCYWGGLLLCSLIGGPLSLPLVHDQTIRNNNVERFSSFFECCYKGPIMNVKGSISQI